MNVAVVGEIIDGDIEFARRNPHSALLVLTFDERIAATAMVGEEEHRGWAYYTKASLN